MLKTTSESSRLNPRRWVGGWAGRRAKAKALTVNMRKGLLQAPAVDFRSFWRGILAFTSLGLRSKDFAR